MRIGMFCTCYVIGINKPNLLYENDPGWIIHIYVYYTYMCRYLRAYLSVCLCMFLSVCVWVSIHVCVYVNMHVCISVVMCVCTCVNLTAACLLALSLSLSLSLCLPLSIYLSIYLSVYVSILYLFVYPYICLYANKSKTGSSNTSRSCYVSSSSLSFWGCLCCLAVFIIKPGMYHNAITWYIKVGSNV